MLTQVAEGVLVHQSELLLNNTAVVQGRAGVLLIDAGITGEEGRSGRRGHRRPTSREARREARATAWSEPAVRPRAAQERPVRQQAAQGPPEQPRAEPEPPGEPADRTEAVAPLQGPRMRCRYLLDVRVSLSNPAMHSRRHGRREKIVSMRKPIVRQARPC